MELVNFKCKTCGAPLSELVAQSTNGLVTCPYCGNVWTVPKQDTCPDALQFLHIGEHDLDTGKFDDAYAAYKKAAEFDPKEPEAYFGMALAEFKVQYLKDHVNNRVQPICYEVTDKKFTDSVSYMRALLNATPEQKIEYEKKGAEIDYILGEFYKLKQSGLDYDCFICVKVTDDKTKQLTDDSKDADYIYRLLQDKGYKPFFSERELRNVTGADYEARILYTLSTSECMLVVCHDESYLQTPWVKNEYSRFLKLINDEEKESDSITIVFNGKPIEKLPGKNGKIQGINFALREADGKVVNFVDTHTPEAKARREEEERRKIKEQQETAKRFKELEEQIKNATASQKSVESDEMNKRFKELQEQINHMIAQTSSTPAQTPPKVPSKAPSNGINNFDIKDNVLKEYKGTGSKVTIPSGVKSIGKFAFYGCKSLTSITIPNSVTSIGEFAFSDCGNLTSITIPNSVTFIGQSAFYGCKILTSVTIPNSVTSIGERTFSGCKILTSITIPNSVTSIRGFAFSCCESLTSITLDEGITSIGEGAFYGCKSLTSVTIPDSVTSIGEGAFIRCYSLETLIVKEGNLNYYSQNNCIIEKNTNKIILGCKNSIIPKNVVEIGSDAFCGDKNIEPCPIEEDNPIFFLQNNCIINRNTNELVVGCDRSIIPENIMSIGSSAFYGCNNSSITIPNSVTSIGERAFSGCKSLTSIKLGDNVTSIGEFAFSDCGNLTSITIPNSVTSIGESAFSGCKSLTSITIPNSVTSIGKSAFSGCKSLTSITIPNSVTSIGKSAFLGCDSLKSAYFESVTGWVYDNEHLSETELSDAHSAAQRLTKFYNVWSKTPVSEPSTLVSKTPTPIKKETTPISKTPMPTATVKVEPKKEESAPKKKEGFFSRLFGRKNK